jgi:hypothetical protein
MLMDDSVPLEERVHKGTIITVTAWRDELNDILEMFDNGDHDDGTERLMMLSSDIADSWMSFQAATNPLAHEVEESVDALIGGDASQLIKLMNRHGMNRHGIAAEPIDTRPLDDRLPSRGDEDDPHQIH